MSEVRPTGTPCPIDEAPLDMDKCQPCRFFRGASLPPGQKHWRIVCNWPRDGSEVFRPAIPDAFTEVRWDG